MDTLDTKSVKTASRTWKAFGTGADFDNGNIEEEHYDENLSRFLGGLDDSGRWYFITYLGCTGSNPMCGFRTKYRTGFSIQMLGRQQANSTAVMKGRLVLNGSVVVLR